ncbi:MAG: hypothetical protein ACRCTW_07675 [Lactococcus garvieae]
MDQAVLKYIDPANFLPESTVNVLCSTGMWGITRDQFDEKIVLFENKAIAVIAATVNLKKLQTEAPDVISELCALYAQSQFMLPLLQTDYMQANGQEALDQFNLIIKNIKSAQNKIGFTPDEAFDQRPSVMVFNFKK